MTVQAMLAVVLAAQLSVGMAASPVIGMATAKGSFRLDNSPVAGNGTLTEGVMIETLRATSDLDLNGGVRMRLGAGTRGRIYRDRMVLERGEGQISNGQTAASGFGVEARNLRVLSDEAGSVATVAIRNNSRIQVAALTGKFRVMNASGTMIAAVPAGQALEFEPQVAGATAPTRVTGCVVKRDGHYFLTDDTTHVIVELRGGEVDKYAGHKVEITGSQIPGSKPAGKATQLIQVSDLKDVEKRCSTGGAAAGAAAGGAAAGAGAAGAGGGAAAGAAAGMAVATKAVIAGVAVAAATAGTAVAVTANNDSESN